MKNFLFITLCILAIFLNGCTKQSADHTTIKFSSWGSQSEIEILQPLLKEFEKQNPDIRVEFLHIPQNYFQKLHLLFASNLAPDVLLINNYQSPKYIKAGLLEDLTQYFQEELNGNKFFDKSVENFTYKKGVYAIPRDVSNLVIFYNKDIFDKYNVPYPSTNWTIEDYIKTAQKLTHKRKNGVSVWGISFERDALFWLPYLYSNNGGLFDNEEKVIIGQKESIEALNNYTDLVNKYHVAPDKAQSASLTMAQLFLQQRIAMHLSGRWLVPKYRKDANFNWDIVNFPNGKAGSVVGIDSSGYSMSKSSKQKDASIKLIRFLTSKYASDKMAKSGLIVPARKETAYSDVFLSPHEKPAHARIFLDVIPYGKTTIVNENYQKVTDILNQTLEPLFDGKKKAQEVITPLLLEQIQNP